MKFQFGLSLAIAFLLSYITVSIPAQQPKKNKAKNTAQQSKKNKAKNTVKKTTSKTKSVADKQRTLITKPIKQKATQLQGDPRNMQWLSKVCELNRYYFEHKVGGQIISGQPYSDAEIYSSYTRQKALDARQRLIDSPEWDDQLPCCPETIDIANESPLFEVDNFFIEWLTLACFHPGAESNFRTSKLYHNASGSDAGQQCTYSKNGKLIPPNQPGAGTPDFNSPTVGKEHIFFDVYPWTKLTLTEYNSAWKPNAGCHNPTNINVDPTVISPGWMYVKRGDVINISATGKIKFDVEGNESTPKGSLAMPQTQLGMLGRDLYPNPLPSAPPGALLGGVVRDLNSFNQEIEIEEDDLFYAGKGGDFIMPATGYLAFLINDGFLENNSGNFKVTSYRKVAR